MEYFTGTIMLLPYTFVPYGMLLCDGSTLSIGQYQMLFALISNKYGGDGTNNFKLPNMLGQEPHPSMKYYIVFDGIFPPHP